MTVTPTDFDVAFGDMAQEMIAESGRSLLLRQPAQSESQSGTDAGAVVMSPLSSAALTVDGLHLAGVTVIDLNAVGVTGLLVAGDVLTIGGVEYTVTGGPYAVTAGGILNAGITPALEANAADEAAVTVAFDGTLTAIKGVVTQASYRMITAGLAKVGDQAVLVSRAALEAAGVTVTPGDELHMGPTVADRLAVVEQVIPIASGELDAAFYLVARLR